MLRHIGLLGATAPAVKGLQNLNFNEQLDYSEFSEFSEFAEVTSENTYNEDINAVKSKLLSKIEEMEKVISKMELESAIQKVIEVSKNDFLNDSDFLEDIGIYGYMEDDVTLHIIEILTNVNNINWEYTIDTRLRFPQEMEITLRDNWKGKVKILKYDKSKIV
jgi:ribosome-binding ATPase YchF (GTP1/OBG family)